MTEERCGADCPHVMLRRCPNCDVEMYGPAVWDFSHGEARCGCGFRPVPSTHPISRGT